MFLRSFRLALGVLAAVVVSSARADLFKLEDLGTLGGGYSTATAITNNGLVTGYSSILGGTLHGFYWSPTAGMVDINPSGGTTFGYDINSSGKVVGQTGGQAFSWTQSGGITLLDPTFQGAALSVNVGGLVVGYREDGTADRSIRWNALTNAPTVRFPTADTRAVAVGATGGVVGTENDGASGYFSAASGIRTSTGSFIPFDYNDSGVAAGGSHGVASSFDVNTLTMLELGKLLSTDSSSTARGISSDGWIVGDSSESGAFLYDPINGMRSINSLLDPAYGDWRVSSLNSISPDGKLMAGTAWVHGEEHAVVLQIQTSAVPEPTLIGMMVIPFEGAKLGYDWMENNVAKRCEQEAKCKQIKVTADVPIYRVTKADEADKRKAMGSLAHALRNQKNSEASKKIAREALDSLKYSFEKEE
ncbi:DUF3466 family protein [bacterium]|nr:DUF3466 family protein [bacterium]